MSILRVAFNDNPHPGADIRNIEITFRGENLSRRSAEEINYYLSKPGWHKLIGAYLDYEEITLEKLKEMVEVGLGA